MWSNILLRQKQNECQFNIQKSYLAWASQWKEAHTQRRQFDLIWFFWKLHQTEKFIHPMLYTSPRDVNTASNVNQKTFVFDI